MIVILGKCYSRNPAGRDSLDGVHVVLADGRDELGGLVLVDGSVVPVPVVSLDAQLQGCQLKLEIRSALINHTV